MSRRAPRGVGVRAAAFAMAIVVLAACTSSPRRESSLPAAESEARQSLHEAAVGLSTRDCSGPAWRLEGRVAVSNGQDGGSGRIEWTQGGGRYAIELGAPVTRQSWRLSGGPDGATLAGVEGGPRTGPDADALLRDATRWAIPVAALGCWVRGARADEARFGVATVVHGSGPQGRLTRMLQDGWTIDYTAWSPSTSAQPALPLRLVAARGEAKVRLIVDAWSAP